MQVALNNILTNQSIELFKSFLVNIIDNYESKKTIYNHKNEIKAIRENIQFLNENLEELINNKEFDKLEDEILNLKFYIEKLLDTHLPINLKKDLNLLYEDLVMFIFNISMYDMKNEVENIRNQAMQKTLP